MTATCFFCALSNRYREVTETDQWLAHAPNDPRVYACPEHWDMIRKHGVSFDGNGTPSIRQPAATPSRPAASPERFLPLIEQMYAREWLLERALDCYRHYAKLLESEPDLVGEESIEVAVRQLNEAEEALVKGPVRV